MKKNAFLIMLVFFITTKSIQAQIDELANMSLEELMQITIDVSSTEAVNIFNTPSNVTLIDRETILRYEYQTVAEAIRSVAGIEVLQSNIDRNITTSRGVLQNYYTNKVLIMINGISTWQPIYGSGVIDRIDINDVERIEILKGPASVLYGTNAYTGVVNIVLKEASANEVNAKLQVGNHYLGAGSVNLTHVNKDFKLFMAANSFYEKREPYELLSTRGQLFNGDSVYFYEEQYIGYNLSSEAQYKNHHVFFNKFMFEHTSPGISPSYTSGGGSLVQDDGVMINYHYDGNLNEKFRLIASALYDYNHRIWNTNATADIALELGAQRLQGILKGHYTFNEKLNFELGFEGFHGKSFGHKTVNVLQDTVVRSNMKDEENLTEWSGVAQLNYKMGVVNLLAGSRFTQNKQFGSNISSRVSALINLNENNSLKLIFGQSFRAPTMLELYFNHPTVVGNKDLQPETSTSYELAYLVRAGNFFAQIIGYYAEYDQLIQRYTPVVGQPATYRNSEAFNGLGTEIELKYVNPKIVNAYLNYNYIQGKGDFAEANYKFVPAHTVAFGISKPIQNFAITLNGYMYSGAEGYYGSIDPQTMLDANVSFKHESGDIKLTHKFSALNLTNSDMLIPEYIRVTKNINTMSTTEFGMRFIYTLFLNF